jgi:hypothetical protein
MGPRARGTGLRVDLVLGAVGRAQIVNKVGRLSDAAGDYASRIAFRSLALAASGFIGAALISPVCLLLGNGELYWLLGLGAVLFTAHNLPTILRIEQESRPKRGL